MAATRAAIGLWHRLLALLGSLLGVLAPGASRAVDLPGDKAEALVHSYIGGGVNAGPVFKDVMSFALEALRIPPTGTKPGRLKLTWHGR